MPKKRKGIERRRAHKANNFKNKLKEESGFLQWVSVSLGSLIIIWSRLQYRKHGKKI